MTITQTMRQDSIFQYDTHILRGAVAGFARNDESTLEELAALLYVTRERVIDYTPMLTPLQKLVPIKAEVANWADSFVLTDGFTVGEPKIISDNADDLPTIERGLNAHATRAHLLGASYCYSVPELEKARANGLELPTDKAIYVRQEMDRKIATIGVYGDADYAMQGLLTYPFTTIEDSVEAKTALAKITSFINQHWNLKGGVFPVTHIVLPQALYDDISITPSNPNTNLTVLAALKQANPGIEFVKANELNAAGKSGKGSIVIGTIRNDILRNRVPVAFTALPAQARNINVYVPCYCKVAGLEVLQKDAILRVDLK